MIETLRLYMFYFIHPFESARSLREEISFPQLDWDQSLAISWLFNILRAILVVITFYIGLFITEKIVSLAGGTSGVWQQNFVLIMASKKMFFLCLALEVVFYPISYYFSIFLFKFFISLSLSLFGKDNSEEQVGQVLLVAMSNQVLKLIPIMGGAFYFLGLFIGLFAGLRGNLQLTMGQSFFTLLLPFVFLGTFFILFISFLFFFVFSGLSYVMT